MANSSGSFVSTTEAGPELNAEVAEKVMGWTDLFEERHPRTNELVLRGITPNKLRYRFAIPKFSTNIAAAWEVVKKLPSLGIDNFQLRWHIGTSGKFVAEAAKTPVVPSGEMFRGVADTAPLTICLAALKAVNHGND